MRRITYIFFLLLLPGLLKAQARLERPEHYVGINGGAVGSLMRFSPSVSLNPLFGGTGGVGWRCLTDKHFGFQLELNYQQRGWAEKKADYNRQLDYVELPFLSHLYFGKRARFIFNLGPQLSLLVHDGYRGTEAPVEEPDLYAIKNKFDYGICGGPGFEVHFAKRQVLYLDARFTYGLGNVFSVSKTAVPKYNASSNFNLALTMGWMMRVN